MSASEQLDQWGERLVVAGPARWIEIARELTLSTAVIFCERLSYSLHFALSRMNITVRSKIMSNIGCGLNEL